MDVQETVAAPVGTEEPTPLPEAGSIAEHVSQFSKEAQETQATETPEEKAERLHHSAQQKREKETGKFEPGKVRHRAASQKAGPEDVPRIKELTARAKGAEERAAAAEAEVARLKAQHAPPAQIAKAEAKADQASAAVDDDPEPNEDDPKFAGDYGKYLRAVSAWEGRQAYRNEKKAEREQATKAQREESERAALKSWGDRVASERAKHADFDAVAFGPTVIPANSAVDAWIMEHKAGAAVLYYLQSHRPELDSLLAKPVLEQLEDLTLLSQRLLSPSSAQAGTTGSAAGRPTQITAPPKPPNPVRTEAQRASDSPPPTDGSLSIAEHSKAFGKRR